MRVSQSLVIFLVLIFLLAVPATAAAGTPAIQPVRTLQPVTTTPAPVAVLSLRQVPVTTIQAVYSTCDAPAICTGEQAATASWGPGNYSRESDTPCLNTSVPATMGTANGLYCFRAKTLNPSQQLRTPVPALTNQVRTIPPAVTEAQTYPVTVAVTQYPAPGSVNTSALATITGPSAGSTVMERYSTVAVPAVTEKTATVKQTGFVAGILSFFAGLFGQPASTDTPPGGNNEPGGDLPGGMKPVDHTTPVKPTTTMDNAITVTSPVAGTSYADGEKIPVKWVKPNNPSGTVNLRLLSQDGMTQTEWGSAIVPNTGSFDWFQQDLAHDCGLPGNNACWGGLTPDQMGIVQPIKYNDAWDLPPATNVWVTVSTDPLDPYPAFHGQSGVFTIINPRAFIDTRVNQSRYMRTGSYPSQTDSGVLDPGDVAWVGYRHSPYGGTTGISHELWRAVIRPEFTYGGSVRKATLTLKLAGTDKGSGNGVTPETQDVNTNSAISQVWILDGDYAGFKPASQQPVIQTCNVPTTAGSTPCASFDPATGTVTVDITSGANAWFSHYGYKAAIVLVGPDETEIDSPGFYYTRYSVQSLTLEMN